MADERPPTVHADLEAAALLAADGIEAGVFHVPSVKPVDAAALAEAARGVRLVGTAEEHPVVGGLGGLVAEVVTARVPRRVERIGIEDIWGRVRPQRMAAGPPRAHAHAGRRVGAGALASE